MATDDLSRQYASALSILAVAVFVGVPIWWKTTEVYRCPLPYKEIEELRNKHVPPELTVKISVALLSKSDTNGDQTVNTLVARLSKELGVGSIAARSTRIIIQYSVHPHRLSSNDKSRLLSFLSSDTPEEFSSHLSDILPSSLGHYFLVLIPEGLLPHDEISHASQEWEKAPVFVSKYRHTIVRLKDVTDPLPQVPNMLKVIKTVYGDRKQLEKSLKNAAGTNQDRVDAESMRQLRASQGYQLSFTLLNPDPSQVETSWNIQEATQNILAPFLSHSGISSLGNFTVSSQEFYYTKTKFTPKRSGDEDGFYVLQSHLPPMISSVESKLASHVSQFPSLNFLVYVPKKGEYPLHIRLHSASAKDVTDNFLVPQWGGVIFHNPAEFLEQKSGDSNATPLRVKVPMERLMPVFVKQLRMLLGVPETPAAQDDGKLHYSSGRHGIVDWRVDQLLLAKLIESTSMASTSLVSLVQLLDKVKNMIISDHIQREVEYSLFSIQECYSEASKGNLSGAYDFAKRAMQSAEIAFFDPSILELLYFPDDQKFAIYIPLFLPISVPIFFSSMAALKWLGAVFKAKSTDSTAHSDNKEVNSEPEATLHNET